MIKIFERSQISYKSSLSFCFTWNFLWNCNINSVIMDRIEAAFIEVVHFALLWPCRFLVKSATLDMLEFLLSSSTLMLSLPFSLIWVNMSKQLCWHGSHHPNVYTVLQNRGKLLKKNPLFEIYLTYRCVCGFRMLLRPLFLRASSVWYNNCGIFLQCETCCC